MRMFLVLKAIAFIMLCLIFNCACEQSNNKKISGSKKQTNAFNSTLWSESICSDSAVFWNIANKDNPKAQDLMKSWFEYCYLRSFQQGRSTLPGIPRYYDGHSVDYDALIPRHLELSDFAKSTLKEHGFFSKDFTDLDQSIMFTDAHYFLMMSDRYIKDASYCQKNQSYDTWSKVLACSMSRTLFSIYEVKPYNPRYLEMALEQLSATSLQMAAEICAKLAAGDVVLFDEMFGKHRNYFLKKLSSYDNQTSDEAELCGKYGQLCELIRQHIATKQNLKPVN